MRPCLACGPSGRHSGGGCVPLLPLVRFLQANLECDGVRGGDMPVADLAALMMCSKATVYHARAYGVDRYHADRIAVSLGYHPLVIWGDLWLYDPGDLPAGIVSAW